MSPALLEQPRMPHVLNYGMGVESTEILRRWCRMTNQERGFRLEDLIVLTAQTGDEFESTQRLVEEFVFPMMREHNIRFVEIAKAGPLQKDGYTLLQDTRQPYDLHIEGDYKLSDLMHSRGSIPAFGSSHKCAMKFKGYIIDLWLQDNLNCQAFGPYLGYNSDETNRAKKCREYTALGMEYRFPLIEWNCPRSQCLYNIWWDFGVIWKKSCCKYCPFQNLQAAVQRYKEEPAAAAFALFTEMLALAFNPRMHLFSSGAAFDKVVASGNAAALDAYNRLLSSQEYALYLVERTYERPISEKTGKPFHRINRRVTTHARGDKTELLKQLSKLAVEHNESIDEGYGASRVYTHRRDDKDYPSVEAFWVVCPGLMEDKVRNANKFQQIWDELTGTVYQMSLLS